MSDLLQKLESATEGSRDLDIAIAEHVIGTGWASESDIPHFSTNLQDAVSLLRDGEEYEISTIYGIAHVTLPLNTNDPDGPYSVRREDGTVCLAFCECVLKAHQSKAETA